MTEHVSWTKTARTWTTIHQKLKESEKDKEKEIEKETEKVMERETEKGTEKATNQEKTEEDQDIVKKKLKFRQVKPIRNTTKK